MTDTEIRIKTLLGLISDRVNEIKNPRCELIHEHLQDLEAEIKKLKADSELLDCVDEIPVFHIDKNHSQINGLLMCLCEQNHKEIRADNIRDLFDQAIKGE